MTIEMRLPPDLFDAIKSGKKKIENRVNDEKRRQIRIGDRIILKKRPDCTETCTVTVAGLLFYPDFDRMLDDIPMHLLGLPEDSRAAEKQLLQQFYSPEEEKEWGVIGIRMELSN